jgi:hypothetical protein
MVAVDDLLAHSTIGRHPGTLTNADHDSATPDLEVG